MIRTPDSMFLLEISPVFETARKPVFNDGIIDLSFSISKGQNWNMERGFCRFSTDFYR